MIYQGNMRAEGIIFFRGWMNHHKVAPLNTPCPGSRFISLQLKSFSFFEGSQDLKKAVFATRNIFMGYQVTSDRFQRVFSGEGTLQGMTFKKK